MSVLEVLIAFTALMGGLLGFAHSLMSSMKASSTSHEAVIAREAARTQIEALREQPFDQLFALYNADPQDDPDGPGSAPGNGFPVEGLAAPDDDPDALAGEILLPNSPGTPGVLREDLKDRRLGLPRDLNGDGQTDAADHADDYRLLPVVVRVEWQSSSGTGRVELRTMLADLR